MSCPSASESRVLPAPQPLKHKPPGQGHTSHDWDGPRGPSEGVRTDGAGPLLRPGLQGGLGPFLNLRFVSDPGHPTPDGLTKKRGGEDWLDAHRGLSGGGGGGRLLNRNIPGGRQHFQNSFSHFEISHETTSCLERFSKFSSLSLPKKPKTKKTHDLFFSIVSAWQDKLLRILELQTRSRVCCQVRGEGTRSGPAE